MYKKHKHKLLNKEKPKRKKKIALMWRNTNKQAKKTANDNIKKERTQFQDSKNIRLLIDLLSYKLYRQIMSSCQNKTKQKVPIDL